LRRAPNKSKQIQTIPRKKAWISLDFFGRFGAFQWLTVKPSKKILSLSPMLSKPLFLRARSGSVRRLGKSYHQFRLLTRRGALRRLASGCVWLTQRNFEFPSGNTVEFSRHFARKWIIIGSSGPDPQLPVPEPIQAETGKEWGASP
jgi:hypothetical protein